MDININVTLDSGTTKAIALLAESILAAATELNRPAAPAGGPLAAVAETATAEAEPEKPKRRRSRAAKPAAVATPATENEAPASAPDPAPAAKVTREEVRKAAGAFLEAGNDRADVKTWLEEFGSESITAMDEKHLPQMLERLTA